MNLLNICLKLPNIGLITFYLVFVFLIPLSISYFGNYAVMKYYLPLIVALANLFTQVGSPYIFEKLYQIYPKDSVSVASTTILNCIALAGIFWQTVEYSGLQKKGSKYAIVFGLILYFITFPLATHGLKYVLDQTDVIINKKRESRGEYKHNWHRLLFGLLYIIILLGLETILLAILDNTLYQYLRDLGDLNFYPFKCPNGAQGKSRGSA